MAEITILDALQAFHRELVALNAGYGDATESLNNEVLVQIFEQELFKIWLPPAKNDKSRNTIKSGTIIPLQLHCTHTRIINKRRRQVIGGRSGI